MFVAPRFILACALFSTGRALAQSAVAPPPTSAPVKTPVYDVSTVKLNKTGSGDVNVNTRQTTLVATNWPVKDMLQESFGVRRNLIFGLPAWAESDRYDINAKVLDANPEQLKNLTREQRREMIQTLVVNRFGLKWHMETRVVPAYELVVSKEGSKLTPSHKNDDDGGASMNNTSLQVSNMPLAKFTDILSAELERPVVDKTGLPGRFDFTFRWTREEPGAPDAGQDSDAPPPLFTALQEQLGLKLQPGKDPVQVLVIDSISQPSEN